MYGKDLGFPDAEGVYLGFEFGETFVDVHDVGWRRPRITIMEGTNDQILLNLAQSLSCAPLMDRHRR